MESQKKTNVPLEDALVEAGIGWYTRYVMFAAGLSVFAAFTNAQAMSIVITASDCDLALTSSQKGILTSMDYLGMVFSSQLFGFLADSFGRRKVILWCTGLTALVSILASFSPVAEVLMAAFFVNGFLVGGIFTPAYVYVSEFMPQPNRATGLLVAASFGSLANIYLPSFAWLILPLPIQIPLSSGGLVYTSWRLYTALLSLPQLVAWLALYPLSDTPKYLLNAGEHQTTLNLLQEIYSKNRSRSKEEFPIASLCLDAADGKPKLQEANRSLGTHLSNLVEQTSAIFRRPLLPYTVISCLISLTQVGGYNTMVLWLGEVSQRLTQYKESHASYDASICDVMSAPSANSGGSSGDFRCGVNFTGYIPNMAVGFLQFCFFYIVNFLVRFTGGKLIAIVFSGLALVASLVLVFSTNYYLTLLCLAGVLVLLLTSFPICFSIAAGYFPTSLRSNASSIIMVVGRLFSVVGGMGFGALFDSGHCNWAYYSMSVALSLLTILCLVMPKQRKV